MELAAVAAPSAYVRFSVSIFALYPVFFVDETGTASGRCLPACMHAYLSTREKMPHPLSQPSAVLSCRVSLIQHFKEIRTEYAALRPILPLPFSSLPPYPRIDFTFDFSMVG